MTTRSRTRPLNTGDTPTATAEMKAKAREYFEENARKNAANTKADRARKKLLSLMKDGKVKDFTMSTKVDGKTVSLDIALATPTSTVIDVMKLKELVDDETFLKIISATQAAVKDHAGTVIATQCGVPKKGTENVNVKAAK